MQKKPRSKSIHSDSIQFCFDTSKTKHQELPINLENDNKINGTPCKYCGTFTTHITRKKVGCVAITWGCFLFCTTLVLCWLPCCIDKCKDTNLICVKCQTVKDTVHPNWC